MLGLSCPGIAQAASLNSKKQKAKRVKSQVQSLSLQLGRVARQYEQAVSGLATTNARMKVAEAELDQSIKEQMRCQRLLNHRVASMYRHGSPNFFDVIFSSTSFDDFLTRLDLLRKVSQLDSAVLEDAKRAKANVERYRNELAYVKSKQKKLAKQLASSQRDIAANLARQQKILGGVEGDVAKLAMSSRISAAKRSGQRVSYFSSRGATYVRIGNLVFPVGGPNGFTDSWGASRSGGRSHQGTDIMASHGTPVLATVSGTVEHRSGSRAGNYCYLRGDDGNTYMYAHLGNFGAGGRVNAGQQIGTVGSTGNASASAPHLHFEIHPGGGRSVNPYPSLTR